MALGGGNFVTPNKILPGSYINFISAARASSNLSERGIVAAPLMLDWGICDEVFEVTAEQVKKESLEIFGYEYKAEQLKYIRELFCNAVSGCFYRLNGTGKKASSDYGTARYCGIRGNDIRIVVAANVDAESMFDVTTYLGATKVDVQTAAVMSDLADNRYVVWKRDAVLEATAGMVLSGGENGEVTGTSHQEYLDRMEAYSFHTLCCPVEDEVTKELYISFTKRMRDETGAKFQTVVFNKAADYEGIINLKNKVTDEDCPEYALVYWVAGASAGCAVNKSITNRRYDGELAVYTTYKQSHLEVAMKSGEFALHKVGNDIRVLSDINSLMTFTDDKNNDFSLNQVIRVLDQIGNDIAALFNNKYIGKIQNDAAGRIAFWNDIVTYNKQLETLRAIENFVSEDVVVEKGNDKKSVVVSNAVTPVCAMEKLYMTVVVS